MDMKNKNTSLHYTFKTNTGNEPVSTLVFLSVTYVIKNITFHL